MSLLAAFAAAAACVTYTPITPAPRLPTGYKAVAEAELPELLFGRALWDEVMAPPTVYDLNFVIAFREEGRTRLNGGRVPTGGTYSFDKGEICLTRYAEEACFRLYRDPKGDLMRSVKTKEGVRYTPVYWMPSPDTLPPRRPVLPPGC
jgi:hypothetical protein